MIEIYRQGSSETIARVRCISGTDATENARYVLTVAALGNRKFGPYTYKEARAQLETGALLSPVDARDALFDAFIASR